jgi:hypothetical protein
MPYHNDSISFQLGTIFAFAEMVAMDVKRLALSLPFAPEDYKRLIRDAKRIAREQRVHIRLDKKFLTTDLFPEKFTRGKWVLLIYRQPQVIREYLDLKARKSRLIREEKYKGPKRRAIAHAFGKLLSYNSAIIKEKLIRPKHS